MDYFRWDYWRNFSGRGWIKGDDGYDNSCCDWPLMKQGVASIISRMIPGRVVRVCIEEVQKAKRAIVVVYEMIREADERALETLFTFLGIR